MRQACPDDIGRLQEITQRAYAIYVTRIGREPAPMVADFAGHIARDEVSAGIRSDKIVGYIVAYPRSEDYFIENVAVDPDLAGKGIGSFLMAYAERVARDHQHDTIRLYTNVLMHENFPFYEGLGYHKTREVMEAGFRRAYFEKVLEHS